MSVFTSFTACCTSADKTNIQVLHVCLIAKDEGDEVEDDDGQERDEDVDIALAHVVKKGKGKSSKQTWVTWAKTLTVSRWHPDD